MSERDLDDLLLGLRDAANPLDALADAEARVLDRLDRTMESRPRALHAAFRSARRTVLALVAVGGIATGAAATAAIAAALPSSDAPPPEPSEIRAEPANPSRLPFAAVERSTRRPEGDDRRIIRALAARYPDVRIDDARGVDGADGARAWVVPGRSHTCFGATNREGAGYSCTSNARAAAGSLSSAEVTDDGLVRAVHLVPDDVVAARAGGREFAPRDNLVVVTYSEGTPVIFITKDGSRTTAPK